MNNPLEAALAYAENGWRVLPIHTPTGGIFSCKNGEKCEDPGKHPRIKDWTNKATTDPKQIGAWWKRWPNANIGIATGGESDLVVLDTDSQEATHYMEEEGVPRTPRVKTKKGFHFYFQHPGGAIRNSVGDKIKIDVRGDGGYVVAPPSIHESGCQYEWHFTDHTEPLSELPDWFRNEVSSKESTKNPPGWEKELLDGVEDGNRNEAAGKLVGRYIAQGMTNDEILVLLRGWNLGNNPPLTDSRLVKTVESVRATHERNNPLESVSVPYDPAWIKRVEWPELIQNYLEYTEKISESPPEFHLFTALFTISSLVGRGRYIVQGEDDLYPNQYTLIVAPSSLYKKSSSTAVFRKWLQRVGCMNTMYLGHIGSPEGLFAGLQQNSGHGVCYYSELGLLLAQSGGKTYMSDTLEMLNDLYDCPDYYAKRMAQELRQASTVFFNLLAASQMDSLTRYIKESTLLSGFLPRFTVVYSENLRPHKTWREPPDGNLQRKIGDQFKDIWKGTKAEESCHMDLAPEAKKVYEQWAHERHAEALVAPPQIQPMYGRIESHCLTFAMILSLAHSVKTKTIGEGSVRAAISCSEFVLNSYRKLVMEELTFTNDDRKLKRVHDVIKKYDGPISYRDVLSITGYHTKVVDEVLKTLIASGKIRYVPGPKGGKNYENIG
jgi:hypothetical protein